MRSEMHERAGDGQRRRAATDCLGVPGAGRSAGSGQWFANIRKPRMRRAYQADLRNFCSFVGVAGAEEFRATNRAHVLV